MNSNGPMNSAMDEQYRAGMNSVFEMNSDGPDEQCTKVNNDGLGRGLVQGPVERAAGQGSGWSVGRWACSPGQHAGGGAWDERGVGRGGNRGGEGGGGQRGRQQGGGVVEGRGRRG
ncbi:hypothetical protein NL676_008918 [Syzygium grande]|nr:hypothetical protein NL676_008918 [Syzygium grande]